MDLDELSGSCARLIMRVDAAADKLFKLCRAILSLAIDLRIDLCGKFNLDLRPQGAGDFFQSR